jgi:trimeric autotransporter adhesin
MKKFLIVLTFIFGLSIGFFIPKCNAQINGYFNKVYFKSFVQYAGTSVAIGYNALYNSLSSSDGNCAIGYRTLYANIAGHHNFACGMDALYNNNGGSYNVGIGLAALTTNTSGGQNIGIGSFSLNKNITGSSNISIGYRSGYNALGSGNVFIGNSAGYFETGSNKLYISNTTSTSPLIGGDFSLGIVSINSVLKLTPGSAPATPEEGQIYSNSTDHHLYFYNGTVWVQLDN